MDNPKLSSTLLITEYVMCCSEVVQASNSTKSSVNRRVPSPLALCTNWCPLTDVAAFQKSEWLLLILQIKKNPLVISSLKETGMPPNLLKIFVHVLNVRGGDNKYYYSRCLQKPVCIIFGFALEVHLRKHYNLKAYMHVWLWSHVLVPQCWPLKFNVTLGCIEYVKITLPSI